MKNIKILIEKAKENAVKFTKEGTNKGVSKCVHVLIYQENELYLAHCLEFDIVAEGYSEKEAKKNIEMAIVNHVVYCVGKGNIDKIMNPAPSEYWNSFLFESRPKGKPFKFPKNYKYGNYSLPFLSDIIGGVEYNEGLVHA